MAITSLLSQAFSSDGVLVFGWDMSMHKQVKVAMEANKQLEHETPTPALEVDQQNASASVGLLVFCLALS